MSKRLPKILERDEINSIKRAFHIRNISGLRNRCIIEVMHRAGLRVSEVIHLRPSHVKLIQQKIEVWDGKGGKDRVLPIDTELVEWLRRWKQARPASDWFFCNITKNRTNKPLTTQYLNQMVKRIAKRSNIAEPEKVTCHRFRHTYATELLDDGFSIREVQQLLGHASVATTQVYLHVNQKELSEKIQNRTERKTEKERKIEELENMIRLTQVALAELKQSG
jgi:integrase/recombinase XerD